MKENNKLSFGSIASLFLAMFFSFIVIFVLFAFLRITDYSGYPAVIIFSFINLILIILVASCGIPIIHKAGGAIYAVICMVTAIYTLFEFVYLSFQFKTESITGYLFYQLVILFIYFLIVIPVGINGLKNKN